MSWEQKTLDKLGEVSRGRSKHRPRDDKRLFGGKYPFIQTAEVKNANFYITEYSQTYSEFGLSQSKLWHPGTLCITIAANIADSAILGMDACFPDSVMGFIPYEGVSDVRFVKYCFDLLQRDCKQISQGTAQDNLSWKKLSTIKFPAPPYEKQVRIADILSAYDNLIENNQKQIRLLEEAAQRLYKEWFVDLRFPGYEETEIVEGVPEGWERKKLKELFTYMRGKSYTSKELGDKEGKLLVNLKNIQAWGGYKRGVEKRFAGKYKENQMLGCGDIIMAVTDMTQERRLVGHVALVPELKEGAVFSMDLIKLIPENNIPPCFLYSLLRFSGIAENISKHANGTNVLHLKPDDIMNLDAITPTLQLMKFFDTIVSVLYKKVEKLQTQNILCQQARDRLLPKLMSGELEV